MKIAYATKLNSSLATYIAGGIFIQLAEALATEFSNTKTKEAKYTRNKIINSIKEVEKIVRPITSILDETSKQATEEEVVKLVDLVADVVSLSPEEFKRLNNILIKIKDDRFRKAHSKEV